jgi:hypothetical protein
MYNGGHNLLGGGRYSLSTVVARQSTRPTGASDTNYEYRSGCHFSNACCVTTVVASNSVESVRMLGLMTGLPQSHPSAASETPISTSASYHVQFAGSAVWHFSADSAFVWFFCLQSTACILKFMSIRGFRGTVKMSANVSKLCIISVHTKYKQIWRNTMRKTRQWANE